MFSPEKPTIKSLMVSILSPHFLCYAVAGRSTNSRDWVLIGHIYLQAVRRIARENIAPHCSNDEIESVIHFVSTFAVLAGYETFSIAVHGDPIGELLASTIALDSPAV